MPSKKTTIAQLLAQYNKALNRLTQMYQLQVAQVRSSLVRADVKTKLINNLTKQYNNQVQILKNQLNAAIAQIQSQAAANAAANAASNAANFTSNTAPVANSTPTNQKGNALIIGINYRGTENELGGCITDANNMNEFAKKRGFKNIQLITDDTTVKPTRKNIMDAFTQLLKNANNGDNILFYYSGHGSTVRDTNGNEATGKDQLLVSVDLQAILDDELKAIIQANLKTNVTLFAFFDSCFSGSVLDLKYQYMDTLHQNANTMNVGECETPGNVIMFGGATDTQYGIDTVINGVDQGAFTCAFLENMNKLSNPTWRQLLQGIRDTLKQFGIDQTPQFATGKPLNLNEPISLLSE
jgi:hypothetical protein